MIFALSIFTAISCLFWLLQFFTDSFGTYLFCNLFFAGSWIILASVYVYRECFTNLPSNKVRLLPRSGDV